MRTSWPSITCNFVQDVCLFAEPCKQEEVVNVFEVLQLPCVASADPAKKN